MPLAEGWGTRVRAVDPDGAPVAGALVLGDGEVLGRTDERGIADVARALAPRRLELRHGERALLPGGGIDPATGAYLREAVELRTVFGNR